MKGKESEDGEREGVYLCKHYTDAFTNQAPPNTVMILETPIVTTHRAALHKTLPYKCMDYITKLVQE